MEELHVEASKSTPEIVFDPLTNNLTMRGQSYPENAFAFYNPILEWVDAYLNQLESEVKVVIDFSLAYVNTSSSKCIMMLLERFDQAHAANKNITLHWHYDPDNESELECAEEFKEETSFPFHILPRPTS